MQWVLFDGEDTVTIAALKSSYTKPNRSVEKEKAFIDFLENKIRTDYNIKLYEKERFRYSDKRPNPQKKSNLKKIKISINNQLYEKIRKHFTGSSNSPYEVKRIDSAYIPFLLVKPDLRDLRDLQKEGWWFKTKKAYEDYFATKNSNENILPKKIANKHNYTAYYYSYRYHRIKDFSLTIEDNGTELTLTQQGFHDSKAYEKFTGKAEKGEEIYAILADDQKRQMFIAIHAANLLESGKPLLCNMTATSSALPYSIMSLEVILAKEEQLSEKDKTQIRRYLYLHRYNFRTKPQSIKPKVLEVKGGQSVDMFENILVGLFKVWRYSKKGDILQSFIYINQNYRGICYNKIYKNEEYDEQTCVIQPTKITDKIIDNRVIHITTHPKTKSGLLTSIFIQLPPGFNHEDDALKGVITTRSKGQNLPLQSPFMMKKSNLIIGSDFKEEELSDKDIKLIEPYLKKYIQKNLENSSDPDIQTLYEEFKSIKINQFPN